MRSKLTGAAVLLSMFLALSSVSMADDSFKRLEVTLTQSGFAGESGDLWMIEPSGQWSRQAISVGQVEPVEAQNTGKLTKKQLDRLTQLLRQNDISNLPEKLGSNTRANPRRLTIKWDDIRVELVSPAANDPARSIGRGPEDRAEAIVRAVQEMTQQ